MNSLNVNDWGIYKLLCTKIQNRYKNTQSIIVTIQLFFLTLYISILLLWNNITVNALKFRTLVAYQKRQRQTVQTQIRLLLKKQSDQGLHSLLL